MTQTNDRILDEVAKLMTDAAGAAQGVKREVETMMKSQGERFLKDMDVVRREEFALHDRGVIGLGQAIADGDPDLIHFRCVHG